MGPAVVLLTTPGHWVIGALINNVWSVAGSGSRPAVNQMLLQWFVNYNMNKGWYVVMVAFGVIMQATFSFGAATIYRRAGSRPNAAARAACGGHR